MIRSMTGYGEAERDTPAGRLRLEIKTVNHRFLNTNVKSPPGFDRFERGIVEVLKRHLSRGHATVFLALDRSMAEGSDGPAVDLERARGYREALAALKDALDLPGDVDVALMAGFGDLFRAREVDRTEGVEPDDVLALAEAAASAVRTLREAEGERLETDLRERLAAISTHLGTVEVRAPQRLVEQRDRLRTAVLELADQVEVDEERLAREIAYLAERWDINEEVVRFRSHIELFEEALSAEGDEPVGKRLGFLVQEMHREANTIGSKANDTELTHAAVTIKEEIERIREQVENVE